MGTGDVSQLSEETCWTLCQSVCVVIIKMKNFASGNPVIASGDLFCPVGYRRLYESSLGRMTVKSNLRGTRAKSERNE